MDQQEISKIWKFLDTLSETDPVAYKNFLEQQRKEGKIIVSCLIIYFIILKTYFVI